MKYENRIAVSTNQTRLRSFRWPWNGTCPTNNIHTAWKLVANFQLPGLFLDAKVTVRDKIAFSCTTFLSSGLLGDYSGFALTPVKFKTLYEHFGFRGRQEHCDAYVQDFKVVWIQIEEKCRNACASARTQRRLVQVAWRHRKTHEEIWSTEGGSRDPVILSRCRRKERRKKKAGQPRPKFIQITWKRMLARWLRRGWRRPKEDSLPYH